MHEASLMKDLLRRIDEIAMAERADQVVVVSVWLGALSHMSADHFTEHFEHAALGGRAEGARLDITVSDDIDHPNAQDLLLKSIQVAT
jgi:hydrogenase nickel incorporation protein HypA/HybF